MSLTVAYLSCRRDNRIEYFFDSLANQLPANQELELIAVDRFADEPGRQHEIRMKFARAFVAWSEARLRIATPKPTVWSGPNRLTKQDWFAAANARNSALCLCDTTHIAYVDDISVLMPGWLGAVQEAVAGNYIGLGAYKKVRNLVVQDGLAVSYEETPAGTDNRLALVSKDVSECNGEWLYGCSLVAPVEALLSIDGWPENLCDGMGFEDCLTGIVLQNAGYHLKYDRRMLTLESDELHSAEPAFKRSDYGVSPDDKSHRALEIARQSKTFDNGFGEGGIRELRRRVLAGEPFPVKGTPEHEWFTGTPLRDLE